MSVLRVFWWLLRYAVRPSSWDGRLHRALKPKEQRQVVTDLAGVAAGTCLVHPPAGKRWPWGIHLRGMSEENAGKLMAWLNEGKMSREEWDAL